MEKGQMRRAQGWVQRAIGLLLAALVSACAGTPRDASLPMSDPNEQMNRQMLEANQAVLGPMSEFVKAMISMRI